MKPNRIITLCAMAATLAIGVNSLLAQDTTTGDTNGGSQHRQRGGPGGGNWDPAQMQQRMLERIQEQLGFTNDTEWAAVKPLVQKVLDAQRDTRGNGMRALFGSGRSRGGDRGGDQGGSSRGGSMFGQTSPEQQALENALEDNAPASQVNGLLAKYKASQKVKQAKLEAAQADLKAVLTSKQEAQAYLLGLVN